MDKTLRETVIWHIIQTTLFIVEAKKKPLKERSRYYKASYFFSSLVVEAMIYHLIKNRYDEGEKIKLEPGEQYEYKPVVPLTKDIQHKGSTNQLFICQKIDKEFKWDTNIQLIRLNRVGKEMGIFSKGFFNKLETMRKRRNKIHLQSLDSFDHKYTKRDVDTLYAIIVDLIGVLKKFGYS